MQLLPVTSRRGVLAVLAFLAFCLALPDTAAAQTVPTVSVSGGSATEGNAVEFTITLSKASAETVSVNYTPHRDQDVAELGVDASFEFVFMPERDEEI